MPQRSKDTAAPLDIVIKAVERIHNPLLLFVIAIVAELIFVLTVGRDIPASLKPVIYTACALPLLVLLVACFRTATREVVQPRLAPNETPRIFNHSDSNDFVSEVKASLDQAKKIVLVGTGINILHRDPIRHTVMSRAARNECQVEIFLANPLSPAVENRLVEEQLGHLPPPVGRPGLIQRLSSLLNERNLLGRPHSILIKLFNHYPAFAFMIIDSKYFFYPYGFAMLGTFSPVIQLSNDGDRCRGMIDFLEKQYQLIAAAAIDPTMTPGDIIATKSAPIAFCFVPPEHSALYRFGTEVVGYDIWNRRGVQSKWITGSARGNDRGFHLACTDGLYFPNPVEARSAAIHAFLLTQQFKSFELDSLMIEADYPDVNSVSLVARDGSGTLEALHAELVCNVYRRAGASETLMGTFGGDLNQQRNELMYKRYKSSQILSAYRPHFPLLRNLPPGRKQSICQELQLMLRERVPSTRVHVDKLVIVAKEDASAVWHVVEEMMLP